MYQPAPLGPPRFNNNPQAGGYPATGPAPQPYGAPGYEQQQVVSPFRPPQQIVVADDHDHLTAAKGYPRTGLIISDKWLRRLERLAFFFAGAGVASGIWWKIAPWLLKVGVFAIS